MQEIGEIMRMLEAVLPAMSRINRRKQARGAGGRL